MAEETQAGTAGTTSQGAAASSGTAAAGTQGSEAAGTETVEGLKAQVAERDAKLAEKNREMLTWKDKIEEANRIKAIAERAASEARTPPTRASASGDFVGQVTAADIAQFQNWAQSEDAATAQYGRTMLASLQLANNSAQRAARAEALLKIPDADRPAVLDVLEKEPQLAVEQARERVKSGKAEGMQAELAAARKRIEELERAKQEAPPAATTHFRDMPPPPAAGATEMTVHQLRALYNSGDKTKIQQARDFEAREAAGTARLLP